MEELYVTCLKIINDDKEHEFIIKGYNDYTLLGGDNFDNILIDHCKKIFEQKRYKMKTKTKKMKIKRESKYSINTIKKLKLFCRTR